MNKLSPRTQAMPPDEPSVTERLLTVQDLARRLGVPKDTIYCWNRTGRSPRRIAVGKHVRYRLADVLAWEDSRYVESA